MPRRVLEFVSAVALVLLVFLLLPDIIAKIIVAVVAIRAVYGHGPRRERPRNTHLFALGAVASAVLVIVGVVVIGLMTWSTGSDEQTGIDRPALPSIVADPTPTFGRQP